MICYVDAGPELRAAFDEILGPKGPLDNVMRVHSLRPSAMMALYKAVLHDPADSLPKWLLASRAVTEESVTPINY